MKKQKRNKRVSVMLNDVAFYALVKQGYISKYGKSYGKNFSGYVCNLIKEDLMRKSNLDIESYHLEKLSIELLMATEERNQLDLKTQELVEKIKNIKKGLSFDNNQTTESMV